MTTITVTCIGSNARVATSPGQEFRIGGAVRPNQARDIRCPDCGRVFGKARIVHTDHGIPTEPMAIVPRHRPA